MSKVKPKRTDKTDTPHPPGCTAVPSVLSLCAPFSSSISFPSLSSSPSASRLLSSFFFVVALRPKCFKEPRMSCHVRQHGLSALQRRIRWRPPRNAEILVLSEVDENSLIGWAQTDTEEGQSRRATHAAARNAHPYHTHTSLRRQVLKATCEPLELCGLTSPSNSQPGGIFLLASSGAMHPSHTGSAWQNVYQLPHTLSTLAAHVRNVNRARLSPVTGLLSSSSHTTLQLPSSDTRPSFDEAVTHTAGLCAPRSKDCVIAEVAALTSPQLGDVMTVAVHQLRRNGSLLLFSPQRFYMPHRMSDYLKWQFASHSMGHLADGTTFLFCTDVTGDHETPRLPQADFPGFVAKGKRRKRHWDRYGRRHDLYVANLSPNFGSAPLSKDTLGESLRRQQEQSKAFDERDDAFFGVSHDMVENNRYASKPED